MTLNTTYGMKFNSMMKTHIKKQMNQFHILAIYLL